MKTVESRSEVSAGIPELYFTDTGLPVKYPVWEITKEELQIQDLLPVAPRPTSKTVEVFSAARQIAKPVKDYVGSVKQRINPEGWAAATVTDVASWFILPAAQALIAINLNTGFDMTDPKLAIAAALSGISLMADRYALSKKGWDISAVGCVAIAATGKPTLSATLEHAINYVGPLNLVNIGAFATGNFSFLTENIMAAPFVLTPWYITMNFLIGRGQADRVINPMRRVREATVDKFKQTIKR